jgi:hypothetical protein
MAEQRPHRVSSEFVHERLRRDEAAREGDVELFGIGLAPDFDCRILRLAVAELVLVVLDNGIETSPVIHQKDFREGALGLTAITQLYQFA